MRTSEEWMALAQEARQLSESLRPESRLPYDELARLGIPWAPYTVGPRACHLQVALQAKAEEFELLAHAAVLVKHFEAAVQLECDVPSADLADLIISAVQDAVRDRRIEGTGGTP